MLKAISGTESVKSYIANEWITTKLKAKKRYGLTLYVVPDICLVAMQNLKNVAQDEYILSLYDPENKYANIHKIFDKIIESAPITKEKNSKWTKEICMKHSTKADSVIEWYRKSPMSYRAAYRLGWLEELKNEINNRRK